MGFADKSVLRLFLAGMAGSDVCVPPSDRGIDNDEAVQKCTAAARASLHEAYCHCRTLEYPSGCKDPNEVLQRCGPEVLKEHLEWQD